MAENEIITSDSPQMQMFSQLMKGLLAKLERYCASARPMLGGEVFLTEGLYKNRDANYTMDEVLADMQAAIPKMCRTKNIVFHCSLNPHPDEKLSDETLSQIAREYMEALG